MKKNDYTQYININTVIIAFEVVWWLILNIQGSTLDTEYMVRHGADYFPLVLQGEWYRLITACLLHFDFVHLAGNMFSQYFLGNTLLAAVGSCNFLLIYFSSGIVGNMLSLTMNFINGSYAVSAGASGCIYGIMGALFMVVKKNGGIYRQINFKRMTLAVIIYILYGFTTPGIDGWAHLGGFITGFLICVGHFKR